MTARFGDLPGDCWFDLRYLPGASFSWEAIGETGLRAGEE